MKQREWIRRRTRKNVFWWMFKLISGKPKILEREVWKHILACGGLATTVWRSKATISFWKWGVQVKFRLTDVWEYYTGFPEGLSSCRIPLWAGETVINLLLVIWQVNVGPKLDCFKRSSSPPPRAAKTTNVSGKCEKGMM